MLRLLLNDRTKRLFSTFKRLFRDETAATAVEYAVMLALIIAVMMGTISQFGSETHGLWSGSIDRLTAAGFMK
ncbi:MAG TPA: Flp family type IVb pilin [Thermogutta sp.]|nr:Flp family type IVb pilin [Thermogutta sp.]HPU06907.1 Flp family type IVb pilin [Thermogutta sp.]